MNRMLSTFCCLGSDYILSDENQRKDVLKVKSDIGMKSENRTTTTTETDEESSFKTGKRKKDDVIRDEKNRPMTECSKVISKVGCSSAISNSRDLWLYPTIGKGGSNHITNSATTTALFISVRATRFTVFIQSYSFLSPFFAFRDIF